MIVLGYNGFGNAADLYARLYGATGINRNLLYGHDAGAALLVDGALVAAVEEERLIREKMTSKFPVRAIEWCLGKGGVSIDQVDLVAFSWHFSDDVVDKMIGEIVDDPGTPVASRLARLHRLAETHQTLLAREAILQDFRLHTGYELDPAKLRLVPHHFAHLMTGHYLAGGGEHAFLISDGRAEWLSAIAGEIRNGVPEVFHDLSVSHRHSLAMLFSVVTRYLGFTPNSDEYKVMGLAGFGPPPKPNPLLEHVVKVGPNGRYEIAHPASAVPTYYELFDRIFGGGPRERETFEYRVKVAAAAQEMVEVVTGAQLKVLESRTALRELIFEGGLALNVVNNGKLLEKSGFDDLKVSFGASDVGVALGAALHAARAGGDAPRLGGSPYLGPSYERKEIVQALEKFADQVVWREVDESAVAGETARLLLKECVVGWFQGRMEYGPRALGNRSILANPSFRGMKDLINERIKHRERFRPFAPIVLEELAPQVFEMGKKKASPYMTFVFPVREAWREKISAACHVDGTARVQTVTEQANPLLARLLREFRALSGVPCLINTSFNVAGEPIVCSPVDAVACFLNTEMDHLVLGNFVVGRRAN